MSYPTLMRSAAKLLFGLAAVIVAGSLIFALLMRFGFGPRSPAGSLALVFGGITTAIPPFVGAAIIWRLDIWLFERGDRS